jgi:hypothetical protein
MTFLIDGGVSGGGGVAETNASFRMTVVSAASSSSVSQASHLRWIVLGVFDKFDFGFA